MPPRQQQKLDFKVIWCSTRCDNFPATNLTAEKKTDNNQNSITQPCIFQTDRVTEHVLLRLDFGEPVVILGAVAQSASSSHIEIHASSCNNYLAMQTKEQQQQGEDDGNLPQQQQQQQPLLTGFNNQKRHLLVEKKTFASPLQHRFRVEQSNHEPLTVRMRSVIPLPNGSNPTPINNGSSRSTLAVVPPFVRFVDVDLRASWEPPQRIDLLALGFVGYVAPKEMLDDYFVKSNLCGGLLVDAKLDQNGAPPPPPSQLQKEKPKATTVVGEKNVENGANSFNTNTNAVGERIRQREPDEAPKNLIPIISPKLPTTEETKQPQTDQQQQPPPPSPSVPNVDEKTAAQNVVPPVNKPPLDGCVLVLSGFQNPLRGQLRDQAQKLGAKVVNDWTNASTHLICAFSGTPKYNDVMSSGHGWIVAKEWIQDSEISGKRASERGYFIGSGGMQK